jgi:GNAT superfamily N-acetyltransferase
VDVRSLGLRTELALRGHAGSLIVDRGGYLVVRTPDNPRFWWGNCLVLAAPPADEAAAATWVSTFETELPGAEHRTFYVDGADLDLEQVAPFAALGFATEASVVLTAAQVHEPPHPNRDATYRPLRGDDDWAQQVDLSLTGSDAGHDPEFAALKARADRALVESGHGRWYGAFAGDRLLSSMGLFIASPGLARFQSVVTHPDARGRGLAGTLTHVVARWGLDELGAQTLVMIADPGYLAVRVYRAVGFADTETLLAVERRPPG